MNRTANNILDGFASILEIWPTGGVRAFPAIPSDLEASQSDAAAIRGDFSAAMRTVRMEIEKDNVRVNVQPSRQIRRGIKTSSGRSTARR